MAKKYIPVKIAEKYIPDYESCPNIDKTGSIKGMCKLFGWKSERVFQIGSYYYHLDSNMIDKLPGIYTENRRTKKG